MQETIFCVGNYEVIQHIADGAFGCVYLVRHHYLSRRRFALKVLNSDRQYSVFEQNRFMQEALFLDVLHHPAIPRLFESGIESNGTPYIVLEYAPNGTLRSLLKRYPSHLMPFTRAMAILDDVAGALTYMHDLGILHHDIKPENILFKENGASMLADFGIALVQENIAVCRAAAMVGTPAYMAPEQYRGYTSRRTDQYSLAVLAYELFTGRLPFEVQTRNEMREMHLYSRPLPPSCFNRSLPPHIDAALLKALEKKRAHRFDDVASFMKALHGACSHLSQALTRESCRVASELPERVVSKQRSIIV